LYNFRHPVSAKKRQATGVLPGQIELQSFCWYDPIIGEWKKKVLLKANAHGTLRAPDFPDRGSRTYNDWAGKITGK